MRRSIGNVNVTSRVWISVVRQNVENTNCHLFIIVKNDRLFDNIQGPSLFHEPYPIIRSLDFQQRRPGAPHQITAAPNLNAVIIDNLEPIRRFVGNNRYPLDGIWIEPRQDDRPFQLPFDTEIVRYIRMTSLPALKFICLRQNRINITSYR